MSMRVHKELMVSTGEYKNNNGEDKKRWSKVGTMFQDDQDPSKMSLVFEVMPLPKPDKQGYPKVSIAMFDPKPRDNQKGGQQQAPQQPMQQQFPGAQQNQSFPQQNGTGNIEDDIPF